MSEPVKLSAPLVRVIRFSAPGDSVEVQCANPDLVRWDRTRVRHKWPTSTDAPFMFMTFVSWAAATRLGLTSDTFDQWEADVADLAEADPDDDDEAGTPTQPGAAPG